MEHFTMRTRKGPELALKITAAAALLAGVSACSGSVEKANSSPAVAASATPEATTPTPSVVPSETVKPETSKPEVSPSAAASPMVCNILGTVTLHKGEQDMLLEGSADSHAISEDLVQNILSGGTPDTMTVEMTDHASYEADRTRIRKVVTVETSELRNVMEGDGDQPYQTKFEANDTVHQGDIELVFSQCATDIPQQD
jgi:hypothetical protein